MTSTTFARVSGFALLVGGPIGLLQLLLSTVLFPDHSATAQQMASVPWIVSAYMYLVAFLLVTIGLIGVHRSQAARSGRLGTAGFLITLIGVLVGGVLLGLLQVLPSGDQSQSGQTSGAPSMVGFLLFITIPVLLIAGGAVLLGVASLRAKVFPQGASTLLIAAGIFGLISLVAPSSVDFILEVLWNGSFFLAFLWFGVAIVAQNRVGMIATSAS